MNHPCVVRLLAVSLRPLCFVLELAPFGSLATVLDELSSKREARENEGSQVSRRRESILGRELSYNIAFQVSVTCREITDALEDYLGTRRCLKVPPRFSFRIVTMLTRDCFFLVSFLTYAVT